VQLTQLPGLQTFCGTFQASEMALSGLIVDSLYLSYAGVRFPRAEPRIDPVFGPLHIQASVRELVIERFVHTVHHPD
jgi:hypothetical protein